MEVKIIIEYKTEYVEEVKKELRLNTSEGIRGYFSGNFVQYANKMDGVESVCVKVLDDKELSEENDSLKETVKEIEKDTARECLKILHSIGGCDATEDYYKGWDKAIDGAYKDISDKYGVTAFDEEDEE